MDPLFLFYPLCKYLFQISPQKMGWCGSCLRASGIALVPLLAILAFFHLECVNEQKLDKVKVGIKQLDSWTHENPKMSPGEPCL